MEIERGFWRREKVIGRGGQASVFLGRTIKPTDANSQSNLPPLMAVKSADVSLCCPLLKENEIFSKLEGCESIIKCYGGKLTYENSQMIFNLFLEFAPNGSLANRIKNSANGVGLPENEVKQYTQSILQGLKHIHGRGFVHRDIKPHNILICENNVAKIADFGLSKMANKQRKKDMFRLKGTPVYMAPETVAYGEYEPGCDVWALGCVVLEMLTGKSAWNFAPKTELKDLLRWIACSGKSPTIPGWVSKEAQSFMEKCFIRDPKLRWSADMLLSHPFVRANTEIEYDLPRPNFLRSDYRAKHIIRQKLTGEEMKRRPDGLQRYFCIRRFAEASQSIKAIPLSGGKRKRTSIGNEVDQKVTDSNSLCISTTTTDGSYNLRRYWYNRRFAEAVSNQSEDIIPFGF
ncbi:Protein kinase domain [Macleaya cordata]|uniref:Protein kinase domain n=1 Tax=Macleaya cordata TaxID=56857 RepID=A0A200QVK0_MACCD|nr:Protein kinase domain [Macleaya cordata]